MLAKSAMALAELMNTIIFSFIIGIGLAVLIVNLIKTKFKKFTLSKPEIITIKIILSIAFIYIIFNCSMHFGIFGMTIDDF